MALPIFAITIFVSAFLLFLVQPLIGKLILPKLGGTPQVWNTCMVFFQSVLLLGYAYTHSITTRLKLRQQLMVHGALLALPLLTMLVFPIYSEVQGWVPPAGANPILQTLGLLALIIGIPFFVVSTSAPLLQKWFGYSGHATAKDPYYLYSVSNLGSMLSLFFYPALIEPLTILQNQAYIWFGGYIVLAGLVLACAYSIFKLAPPDEQILAESAAASEAPPPVADMPAAVPAPEPAPAVSTAVKSGPAPGARSIQRKKGKHVSGVPSRAEEPAAAPSIAKPASAIKRGATAEMTWWRRLRWILLAAVPSSLMLGVTSYISTDLSPFPLVWIVPLALYLLSFIIVYEKAIQWTSKRYLLFGSQHGYSLHEVMVYVGQPLGILVLCFIALTRQFDPVVATLLVMIGFFANALACHGELAEDRPDTKHLTEYFLLMSFGGMVGGLFNGIVAPIVFQTGILEFYIVIAVACFVRPTYNPSGWFDDLILNAFPGFQSWARNQGDELSKSMGRPPQHTTWLFSVILDVVLGVFILSIAYWLKSSETVSKFLSGMKSRDWAPFLYRVLIFGVPMVFCFFFAGRPLRIGLAVSGLLLGNMYLGTSDENILEARRTYFGVLRVSKDREFVRDPEERVDFATQFIKLEDGSEVPPPYPYTFLMHGTTYHGRNYFAEYNEDKLQKYRVDLSRLATTYYHRYGPVGIVMERDNWFKGKQNNFAADARLPVALIGDIAASAGTGFNPLYTAITETQSEPPFATIGLGTGTMVSYARPYQHMTYYEIDDVIRGFSLPEPNPSESAWFTYLQNAVRRGVDVEVIMGDARQSLGREKDNLANAFLYYGDFSKPSEKNPERPYANAPIKKTDRTVDGLGTGREKYYKVINVDAFSSDAIPVHLVTEQAIALYMSKLRDDGVLMVHTSNRHMDLVRPVARIALELSKKSVEAGGPEILCLVGKDSGSREGRETGFMGHFGSEYVMIFRDVGSKKDPEARNIENFGAWQKFLETKKVQFEKNAKIAKDKKTDVRAWPADAMKPSGHAPQGWQILNSPVEWYNPYTDHTAIVSRRLVKAPITANDPLWTDDFSHILSVVRWHWPWE